MSQRFFRYLPILIFPFLGHMGYSQSASFNGPVAGFVFSNISKTVRPLFGVAGATHVDSPIFDQVDSAFIAPGGRWAFVIRSGATILIHRLSDLQPVEHRLDGLMDSVDQVVWSRDGAFALLYSFSTARLQRVQLTENEPSAGPARDISAWGKVSALAIDSSGNQIAVGFATSGLYFFNPGESPAQLSAGARPAALTFDDTGHSLYAVDLATNSILQFEAGSGMSQFVSLSSSADSVVRPVGLATSAGGRYLILADSTTRSVLVYDTSARALANTIALDFAPTRLDMLSSSPVFLLNGNNPKEWLLLLDASEAPAVYFVPAGEGETL